MSQADDDLAFLTRARATSNFAHLCWLTSEESVAGYMDPTPTQAKVFAALYDFNWLYSVKYRQAKVTSAVNVDHLAHVMLRHRGQRGLIIAEKEDTALEAIQRMAIMHRKLPAILHNASPLRKSTSEYLEFEHDGLVSVVAGGGRNPAIGHSPDYLHITEFGEIEDYDSFNPSVFPAIAKRPNARLVIETTPGRHGSAAQSMWYNALAGLGDFTAPRGTSLFLEWWLDDTVVRDVEFGFTRTQEEHKLAEKMRGITDAHFAFRRKQLDTVYHGDTRLFDSKYPPGPYDGWITSGTPTVPLDAVEALIARTNIRLRGGMQKPCHENEEVFYEEREAKAPYLLTADPAKYGQGTDPSAWTLWHGWDHREVGSFSGRMDPGRMADRILKVQKEWDCHVLVESNAGECCEALKARKCPKLVWDSGHPGFHSTEVRKGQALTDMVDMLRREELDVRSLPTLTQLASWDGTSRSRKGGHHFDRAITTMLAAWFFTSRAGWGSRPGKIKEEVEEPIIFPPLNWKRAQEMKAQDKKERGALKHILGARWR